MKQNSDTELKAVRAAYFIKYEKDKIQKKKKHPPPRKDYALSAAGATCQDGR